MHPLFDFPPGMLRPSYQEKVISSLELTKASEALQKRPGSFLFSVVFVHILYIKKMSRMQVSFFILSIFSFAHDAVKVQKNHRSGSCIAFRVYSVCREPFAVLCMKKNKNPYSLFTAAMRPDASNWHLTGVGLYLQNVQNGIVGCDATTPLVTVQANDWSYLQIKSNLQVCIFYVEGIL